MRTSCYSHGVIQLYIRCISVAKVIIKIKLVGRVADFIYLCNLNDMRIISLNT